MATKLPLGGQRVIVNGAQYLIYDTGLGVKVWYSIPDPQSLQGLENLPPAVVVSAEQFSAMLGRNIRGGAIQELFTMADDFDGQNFTYADWVRKTLDTYAGSASWIKDPEVVQIYIDYLTNPDLVTEAELQARLRKTNWWKNRTTEQAAWDDLSPADQAQQIASTATTLAEQHLRIVGQYLSVTDPKIQAWAKDVASGVKTLGQVIGEMRDIALQDPESPWSQEVRRIEESRFDRQVTIEDKTEDVRDLYLRWGIPATDETLRQWASDIVSKKRSVSDLIGWLRQQAQVLYPWKDPNVETRAAAEPYIQTYARIMERPAPSLFDRNIQQALSQGMSLYDYEVYLKSQPEWLTTKNAQDELIQGFSLVGQLMGFN